jgi:hypothetical protein
MNRTETITTGRGNIGMIDRAVRITLGLAVLFGSLYVSVSSPVAYPLIKLVAAAVVLTGIAGWDPFYAAFRRLVESATGKSTAKHAINPA